ncbi:hypothetical protein H696_06318, partial [Fonticula alba]
MLKYLYNLAAPAAPADTSNTVLPYDEYAGAAGPPSSTYPSLNGSPLHASTLVFSVSALSKSLQQKPCSQASAALPVAPNNALTSASLCGSCSTSRSVSRSGSHSSFRSDEFVSDRRWLFRDVSFTIDNHSP